MDLMQRRRELIIGAGNLLPNEYQKVRYIESDGKAYIETDVLPSNGLGFDCVFLTPNAITSYIDYFGCIFGSRIASGNNDLQVTTYTANDKQGIYSGTFRSGAANGYDAGISTNTIQTITKRNGIFINGSGTTITIQDYSWGTVRPIFLFLLNSGNATQGGSGCRIYVMRFYDGNNLIRNYVPCIRKLDSKPGMYETITKTFLTNSVGTLTAGNE